MKRKSLSICMEPLAKYNDSPSRQLISQDLGKVYSRAGILFFELDAQGVIISMNSTAEESLGYDESDVLGMDMLKFTTVQHRTRLKSLIETCFNRGIVRDEYVVLTVENGTRHHYIFNGIAHYDDQGNPAVVQINLSDVNETFKLRRLNDLAVTVMRKSPFNIKSLPDFLEKLRDTLFMGYAGFAWHDHGRMHVVEPGSIPVGPQPICLSWPGIKWEELNEHMALYTQKEERGGGWLPTIDALESCVDEEQFHLYKQVFDKVQFVALWKVTVDDGPPAYLYVLNTKPDEMDEDTYGFIGDLAQQLGPMAMPPKGKEVHTEVKHSSDMPELPFLGVMKVRDGIISQVNHTLQELLDKPANAICGVRLVDQIHDEDRAVFDRMIGGGFSENKDAGRCQLRLLKDNGESCHVNVSFNSIQNGVDHYQLWYFVSREEANRFEMELIQRRKIESMGFMAGGLVHDFNNLMACILGFSSILIEDTNRESPQFSDLSRIHETAEQAAERMTRLMAYAQNGKFIDRYMDVNQLIREVAGIISRTSDKRLSIRADLDDKLERYAGDSSQIQQVILQLALNAKESMPDGGKLFFKTQMINVGERGHYKNQGAKPGKYIQIAVSDTGSGMDYSIKSRMFQAGVTTKDQQSGLGYGLTFIKEIVDAHEGFISVFSEPDRGTMLKVHFPVASNPDVKEVKTGEDQLLMGSETVLLVESELLLISTAKKMLNRYGYRVVSAQTPSETVAKYRKYRNQIDLIIMDIGLKGVPLVKLLRKLEQIQTLPPVLGATAQGAPLSEAYLKQHKMRAMLFKPYQVRPLMQSVRRVLDNQN